MKPAVSMDGSFLLSPAILPQ
ncbi:unnamed protein product [Gulo gulo]|uniref:Uncharacterized protein n=1 Tax=Gulo gulo TaxID=48420 RepID=A0A9X9M5R8_GULGU|nr:unnamed protein product [Gulo gulo]